MSEIRKWKLLNVWDHYMPGQFVEPHANFLNLKRWTSYVCGLRVGFQTKPDSQIFSMTEYQPTTVAPSSRIANIFFRFKRKVTEILNWRQFIAFSRDCVDRVQPDLMLFHFGTTAARMLPLIQNTNCKKAVIFYGVDASAALKQHQWVRRYQRLFEKVDLFLVLSEVVKKRLEAIGCPNEKIRVWNLPAGVEQYPMRQKPIEDIVRFICAARFVEKKGHIHLLKAFAKVQAQHSRVQLTLLGYGPNRKNIEDQLNSLGLQNSVQVIDTHMLPNFHELYYNLLKTHDIFVLPSTAGSDGDDEGGPALTLVCAQAAGLPVICTRFVGSDISVVENQNGLFCEMDDSDSLANKMEYLMNHSELWAPFGRNGNQVVNRLFARAEQYQKLEDDFSDLVRDLGVKNC